MKLKENTPMSKYIDFEYLKQNNPNPNGIQYKGLFGNRSIGKTHGVLKHLVKNRKDDFAPEIIHIKNLLLGNISTSPLDYKFAHETMEIISAAFESNKTGCRVSLKK